VFSLSGDGFTRTTYSVAKATDKTWHHYAMTFAAGVCSTYKDGAYISTGSLVGSWPAKLADKAGSVVFCPVAESARWKGGIAMPVTYATALTAAQVADIYAGTYPGSETLKLTRSSGTTWTDDASSPHNSTHGASGALPSTIGHFAVPPTTNLNLP